MDGGSSSVSGIQFDLIVTEVDGVLTDGRSWPGADGRWRRRFSVRDSIALRAMRKSGAKVAILTRSSSPDIEEFARLIGADALVQDCDDKRAALAILQRTFSVSPSRCAAFVENDEDAWMGEELGCVVAIAGAGAAARESALYVTGAEGGDGAVGEACSFLRSRPDVDADSRAVAG